MKSSDDPEDTSSIGMDPERRHDRLHEYRVADAESWH